MVKKFYKDFMKLLGVTIASAFSFIAVTGFLKLELVKPISPLWMIIIGVIGVILVGYLFKYLKLSI